MRSLACMALLLVACPALAVDLEGGNALAGHRIQQVRHGSGVGVAHNAVVGPDGGTTLLGITARYGTDDYAFSVSLPLGAYRTPARGRELAMGNLELAGFYHHGDLGPFASSIGLEAHFNIGDNAWSYVNDPEELWPTYGGNAVWQGELESNQLTVLVRAQFGVHASLAGVRPYPDVYARFGAAGAVDYAVMNWVGIIGEMSVSYWDTSPWEISGLVRVDAIEGVRFRGGIVLPVGTWAGLGPRDDPAGVRETTLLLDANLAF